MGSRRLRHALSLLTGDRSWDADGLAAATAPVHRLRDLPEAVRRSATG